MVEHGQRQERRESGELRVDRRRRGFAACPLSFLLSPALPAFGGRAKGVRQVCVVLAAVLLSCQQGFGGIEGNVELLRRVAEGHKANREKVLSWRGTVTLTSESDFAGGGGPPGMEGYRARDEGLFVYEARTQATRWNSKRAESTVTREGKQEVPEGPQGYFSSGLMKDGVCYEVGPLSWDREGNLRRRAMTITAGSWRGMGTLLNPMYYLGEGGQDLDELLMSYVRKAGSDDVAGTVSRTGDIVTLEVRTGGDVRRYQFDLAKGCNLVNFLTASGSTTQNRTLEYEEVEGVFLPRRVAEGYVWKQAEGAESVSRREVEFVNEAVNVPVDPSEFELGKLGLEPGDWVRDERTKASYAYGIEGDSEVAGVVVDLEGEPVAGCQVSVRRLSDSLDLRQATTAGDGAFRFKDLPEERLSLEAYLIPQGGGIVRNTARSTVEPGATDVRLVLPLRQKAEALVTLKAGDDAPELVLEEGAPVSLGALKGKAVALAFVSIYSRSSVGLLVQLKAFQAETGADKVAVVAVHDRTAKPEEIEQFRKEQGIPFPIVRVREIDEDGWEGATFHAYGVTRLPMLDLVGPTGKIVGTDLKPEELKTRLKKSE
jgi:hypothetical protein